MKMVQSFRVNGMMDKFFKVPLTTTVAMFIPVNFKVTNLMVKVN